MGWTNTQAETITGVAFTYLASTVLFGAGSTLSIASTAAFTSAADIQVLDAHLYSLYTAPPVDGALRLWCSTFSPVGVVAADLRRSDTDVNPRFTVDYDGAMEWGDGTNPPDTNLYRYAVNGLAMDYALKMAGFATILFGPAGDVNLYRGGANILKTDDAFQATNLTGSRTDFVPSWTGTGAFAIGNGARTASEWITGNRAYMVFKLTYGGTTNAGAGVWTVGVNTAGVPGGFTDTRPVGTWWYVRALSAVRASGPILLLSGTSTFQMMVGGGTPTPAGFTGVGGAAVPGAWTTGDLVIGWLDYPIL